MKPSAAFFHHKGIEYLNASIIVMLISLFLTIALVLFLNCRHLKKGKGMVMKSDALHYKTDVLSNGAYYFIGLDSSDKFWAY